MDFYSETQFRDLARAGTLPSDAGVRSVLAASAEATGDRQMTFTISTSDTDRLGTRILASGWDLEAYRRNPSVLFGHQHGSLPIGRGVRVWVENDRLRATLEFMGPDLSEHADQIYRMLRGAWLRGVSVGFRPLQWRFSDEPDRKGAIDFVRQELIEISITPTPANSDALADPVPGGRRDAGTAERLLLELISLEALR